MCFFSLLFSWNCHTVPNQLSYQSWHRSMESPESRLWDILPWFIVCTSISIWPCSALKLLPTRDGRRLNGASMFLVSQQLRDLAANSNFTYNMNSMKLIIPLKTPNDAVTLQRRSQFTPKMKANVVQRLFHLWCELNSTMNVAEWQVSWNSWYCC